ncbi:polyprotein 1ab [Sesbania bispinosa]|nr:polyprotein 1ab [Sesbania bispinosa]
MSPMFEESMAAYLACHKVASRERQQDKEHEGASSSTKLECPPSKKPRIEGKKGHQISPTINPQIPQPT